MHTVVQIVIVLYKTYNANNNLVPSINVTRPLYFIYVVPCACYAIFTHVLKTIFILERHRERESERFKEKETERNIEKHIIHHLTHIHMVANHLVVIQYKNNSNVK